MSNDRKDHWENIYQTRSPDQVSWFQPTPALSLELIRECHLAPDHTIIDVGGGPSTLVDHLLQAGYRSITVLDIARTALTIAQQRLGEAANQVHWMERMPRTLNWNIRCICGTTGQCFIS